MRKSLVMLALLILLGTSFVVGHVPTEGTGEMSDVAGDTETSGPEAGSSEGVTGSPSPGKAVSAKGRSQGIWNGDDLEIQTSPIELFGGLSDLNDHDGMSTRGASNTSTLIYFRQTEKKVMYNQIFEMAGELLEDNNSDGEKNAGDYPIMKDWVDITWNDGSEFMVFKSVQTQWDNPDENMTPGAWNITLQANETNIAANPIEFLIQYKGAWTTDGSRFYNLTPAMFNSLYRFSWGVDDDDDAYDINNPYNPLYKMSNFIDDDDDGEPNSPDSYLDGSNGFPADNIYQRGEDVGIDMMGGNWIDVNHGLADFVDNNGNGEFGSPDSHKDGSNGYSKDGVYQRGEEISRDRTESYYNEIDRSLGPLQIFNINLGERGPGTEITYDFNVTERKNITLRVTDGTNTYDLETDVNESSGTYVLPAPADWPLSTAWRLIWENPNMEGIEFNYTIDIDADWIDMNAGIADNIDNDGDGLIDEFIDEGIDDGRYGIEAQGTPEPPTLWYNQIDDDGDGIVDDGYPGIKPVDSPEGVDEEIVNGADDDGDGNIDEDPRAYIARRGYEKRLYVEIWHDTETTINLDNDIANVGDTFRVYGSVKDLSVPDTNMGAKTMRLFWDGDYVAETVATPSLTDPWSLYDFNYRIPLEASAGPHVLTVEFSPAYNKSTNYYWNPSNASVVINVRRPTSVIFDVGDPTTGKTYVYKGHTILINGTIIDKYKYEIEKSRQGPRLHIGGWDYGNSYTFKLFINDVQIGFKHIVTDDNGTFSVDVDLQPSIYPLGEYTVRVETDFNLDPKASPLIYYLNSQNSTKYRVRSHTRIEMFLDQNLNWENDRNEGIDSYITRKSFTGPDGTTYDWNVAHIKGYLLDTDETDTNKKGIYGETVQLWWGFQKPWQQSFSLVTSDGGKFHVEIPINRNHELGPVPVYVSFSKDFYASDYDSSSMRDNDGDPFSVVSFTQMNVSSSEAVKGKNVDIKGTLVDDSMVGIGDKTVKLYIRESYDPEGDFSEVEKYPGIFIGEVKTNSIGKFQFQDYVPSTDAFVGKAYVVASFAGSQEFPDDPLGRTGVRFRSNDAFMGTFATPDPFYITSETAIVLDEEKFPHTLTRGGKERIAGRLVESYLGTPKQTGVGGKTIVAYIKQGDEITKFGQAATSEDIQYKGIFEISTKKISTKLDVGKVQLLVEYKPTMNEDGVITYKGSSNVSDSQIWSSTRIDEIEVGPIDTDNDKRINLFEDKVDEWLFSYRILEGATEDTGGEPVPYATVWLNFSMGVYSNTSRGITDSRGKITFNFTAKFQDTATGATFLIPEDKEFENLTITVEFSGKQYYRTSSRERYATYHRPKPIEENPPPYALIFFAIILALVILTVALFFFYRYIEKKRRLKALKKIIKKAADQLETGNPYSAVIFKSYQKLGAHLRRYGFMRRDADTFREFEDAVRSALPIDDNSLDAFLDILEEARYSKHVIGEDHRDRAIGCLRSVEKSLDNIILDEESALRQMEIADEEYSETEIVLKD